MDRIKRHGGVIIAIFAMIVWAGIVWLSGMGWNPSGIRWSFENTAQLGDSFGVLSSIMAAIAAYFAFRTYQSARDDIARLEQRAAEPSYLNLLERRFDVLDRVRIYRVPSRITQKALIEHEHLGQNALDWIVANLRRGAGAKTHPLSKQFTNAIEGVSGLPNLFRFTYHIVAFAERQLSQIPLSEPMTKHDPSYQYVRLLRAQLSDSESVLIALNCAFGHGHDKFKPLVERYALLHNMSRTDIGIFGLLDLFAQEAFGLELKDRVRTDAPVIIEHPPEPGETD